MISVRCRRLKPNASLTNGRTSRPARHDFRLSPPSGCTASNYYGWFGCQSVIVGNWTFPLYSITSLCLCQRHQWACETGLYHVKPSGYPWKERLRRIWFHDLRYSRVSLPYANGASLKETQEWSGHSDISTPSNTYTHLIFYSKVSSANAIMGVYPVGKKCNALQLLRVKRGKRKARKRSYIKRLRVEFFWCRKRDLNPHPVARTGFWVQHVCQFHHSGIYFLSLAPTPPLREIGNI